MKGPVGWFPDPNGGDGLRYFDGQEWTQIAPPPAAAAPAQPVSVVVNNTNTVGGQETNPGCARLILLLCLSPFLIPLTIVLYAINPWVFWVLITVTVVSVLIACMCAEEARNDKRVLARARDRDKLALRAEVEDELYQQGDPRGTYGRYPPPPEEDLK